MLVFISTLCKEEFNYLPYRKTFIEKSFNKNWIFLQWNIKSNISNWRNSVFFFFTIENYTIKIKHYYFVYFFFDSASVIGIYYIVVLRM